ncbi:MAG: 3-phosphoshikimate 1-carboxyvinyltransferase [Actinobacteria bacterium]|nr:3-phosphoshikimate 1-carboxyvinyltransferase [Actinomycetota bacterium]
MEDPTISIPVAAGPVVADVVVPGSKSIANRALVCAALARGTTNLSNMAPGDDTMAMVDCLRSLGVGIEMIAERTRVEGRDGDIRGGATVDARLAGTTSRFVTAVSALGGDATTVDGGAALRRRPMGELHDALRELGANVVSSDGCLPVRVARGGLSGGRIEMRGDVSSQFVSALMMIGPLLPDGLQIDLTTSLVSRPYVAITATVMASFGASGVTVGDHRISVEAGSYTGCDYTIEADASSASYPLAVAAITNGSVRVEGLGEGALQGDAQFADIMEAMGCRVERTTTSTTVIGTGSLHGVVIDMSDLSDLVPTVAAVAAFASSPTRITGVGFIRRKESDRLGDLVRGLSAIGCTAVEEEDGLRIEPMSISGYHGARLSVHDDHRLAMSWSLLALTVPGVSVDDPAVVGKSWPEWWSVRRALLQGARR